MSNWAQLNFQSANSPLINQIVDFHDHLIVIVWLITIIVVYKIISSSSNKWSNFKIVEHHNLEIIWTLIPIIILLIIVFPSIKILYYIEENNPTVTFKVIGHQWFWSYEYSDINNIENDAYIQHFTNTFRLLDTNSRIILPYSVYSRVLATSSDVIHAWTIPSLAVKTDAVPGRLNQINFLIVRPGVYYGQCSEICGANHRFIPINIESVKFKTFLKWIKSLLDGWL